MARKDVKKTREPGVTEAKKMKCFLQTIMVNLAAYQAVMEFENGSLENKSNLNGIVEAKADWQVCERSWKDEKLEELREAHTVNFSEKYAWEREQKEW